ncbi:dUTPase [Bacillus sp. FSL K6-3431]|uniref:dUTPase n=1 Tax=Bacillus sp. FSL K6-3431 TaxID=2921500 RepID=UPI0030F8E7F4
MFETQKVLDDRIVKEKGLEGQDLLDKKILALQVELGEMANELPVVFKFWSNKKNDYDKALKEYVDCLHFILSFGNSIDLEVWKKYDTSWMI